MPRGNDTSATESNGRAGFQFFRHTSSRRRASRGGEKGNADKTQSGGGNSVRRKADTTGNNQEPGSTKSGHGKKWTPKMGSRLNATKKGEKENATSAHHAKRKKTDAKRGRSGDVCNCPMRRATTFFVSPVAMYCAHP